MTFFQNIELLETDKFQYLLIHKNASCSVKETIKSLNPILSTEINLTKVRWTVIRDPYERFISGIKYDLIRQNLNIKDIDINSLYNSKINLFSSGNGNVTHTASQVPYLINSCIDWYIELKNLNNFLKIHFNNVSYENINHKSIELNLDKNEIMKHLDLDYFIYNSILNSDYLWKWQHGRIF